MISASTPASTKKISAVAMYSTPICVLLTRERVAPPRCRLPRALELLPARQPGAAASWVDRALWLASLQSIQKRGQCVQCFLIEVIEARHACTRLDVLNVGDPAAEAVALAPATRPRRCRDGSLRASGPAPMRDVSAMPRTVWHALQRSSVNKRCPCCAAALLRRASPAQLARQAIDQTRRVQQRPRAAPSLRADRRKTPRTRRDARQAAAT